VKGLTHEPTVCKQTHLALPSTPMAMAERRSPIRRIFETIATTAGPEAGAPGTFFA